MKCFRFAFPFGLLAMAWFATGRAQPMPPAQANTASAARLSPHPVLPSGRLARLERDLATDRARALAEFWAEMQVKGTPLIEALGDDPRHALVTFLWRGSPRTQNVVVQPFLRDPQYDYALHRIADTDVWCTTVKMRAGGRFVYRIGENVPVFPNTFPDARSVAADRDAFDNAMRVDPLNPQQLPPRTNANANQGGVFSLVVMPGATPEPWLEKRAEVPSGKSTQTTLRSEKLQNQRTITVYTPPGYEASAEPFGLLVVFDEERYLSLIPAATILENLFAAKRLAPLVMVLVGNPSRQARMVELPCNPAFADFLAAELIPWVRKNYRVTSDPARTTVSGSSYGGLASTYVALRYPEIFGNVLSQSGSFGWTPPPDPAKPRDFDPEREKNHVASLFLAAPKLPVRFYLDAGTEEIDFSLPGARNLIPNRHFRDVLKAKGYEVHYREFVGGHDEASWRATFPEGLLALWGTPPQP